MHGVVLAGGDSRRMGSDKAEILIGGEPLWRRQVRVLREAGAERIMLVRKAGQPAPDGIEILRDSVEGAGPMAGLHAALASSSAPWVAVLAVDMPGIDATWFRWLRGLCRPGIGAMVRHSRACEPLAAIYPVGAITEIASRLGRQDFSLQQLALALESEGRMTLVPISDAEAAKTVSVNTVGQLNDFSEVERVALNPLDRLESNERVVGDSLHLFSELRSAGLISGATPRATALGGGVSSDIFLVEDGAHRFVVKRALPKLRVKDDWFADVGRNRVEQAFFAYAARFMPDAVPHVLRANPEQGWFAMEFLGGGLRNWKAELLAGRADAGTARLAGATLGRLHAASWGDPVAREEFATLGNFTALRIEPYLLSTAERVPALSGILRDEAGRLAATQLALVHGDYSPKNLLVAPGRLIVLDAETAWFGDPAFDAAFLLNHLYLKALHHAAAPDPLIVLVAEAWRGYTAALGRHSSHELESRTAGLVLCLMLARVHGKSPAEYLTEPKQREFITDFAGRHLPHPPSTMAELTAIWREGLRKFRVA